MTKRKIALIFIALTMLTSVVGVYAHNVLRPSNTLTAKNTINVPQPMKISWLEGPRTALAGEEFTMIVKMQNPNARVLEGWIFNVTIMGENLWEPINPTKPLVVLAFSTTDLDSPMILYQNVFPFGDMLPNRLVYLGPYPTMEIKPGETKWGIVGKSLTSGTLSWTVTLIPSPYFVPAKPYVYPYTYGSPTVPSAPELPQPTP